ncbi:coiled-coil domain-containing protein 1-like [Mytilus californianus]|uniref:coiled-coil domain-containing protein 1-like n=1 Tax=Mytilus californianus TaxID=6549 RepID=UPI00224774F7|nr:coiled-coil domain-containing protein 1-like [Mytilus californianus]
MSDTSIKPGEDNGSPSWYPLPFIDIKVIEDSEQVKYNGTYKHVNCSGKVRKGDGLTCFICRDEDDNCDSDTYRDDDNTVDDNLRTDTNRDDDLGTNTNRDDDNTDDDHLGTDTNRDDDLGTNTNRDDDNTDDDHLEMILTEMMTIPRMIILELILMP